MLDKALIEMILGSLADIATWIDAGGGIFTLDDVNWDFSAAGADPGHEYNHPREALEGEDLRLKASHAIGFVCGVAAGRDVTPKELLWDLGIDTERPFTTVQPKKQRAARARKGSRRHG